MNLEPISTILVNMTDKIGYNTEDQSHALAYHDAIDAIITYLRSLQLNSQTDDVELQAYRNGYNQALKDIEKAL